MANSVIQPSFTGGELSPSLYGRVDLARYQTSVRTLRNFISQMYGGATNRPGFQFLNEVKDSTLRVRLIPFEFSTVQTYVIEVGHLYMRFYMDGGLIESSPGTPYEIVTPWSEDEIFDLKFTQSADVMTLCHPDYAPRQLTRTAHTSWTLLPYQNKNGPFRDINTDESITITASIPTGSGITLTASSGIFSASDVGMLVYLEDAHLEDVKPWAPGQTNDPPGTLFVGALRRSEGNVYLCTAIPTTLGTKGYRTGGNRPLHLEGSAWDGDTSIESTGSYAEGVEWQYLHASYGIAQITGYTSPTQVNADVISRLSNSVASSGTYKWALGAWGGSQGYPSCVTYDQERQIFAATPAEPQNFWMSKVGAYTDFGASVPTQDDDAISKSIPGRQVNAIRHLLPMDRLIILTSGAEYVVYGDGDQNVLTPTCVAKAQTYRGSSQLTPIVIGDMGLYLQDKGSVVRDLGYRYESDNYTGEDLTVLSSHLFRGRQIVDWAFTQVPWSVVWCVRDDGVLLGMTYYREQQVVGWHRHDTDGEFESVCSISEGTEDALYAVIKRTIDGTEKRYVERLHTRQFTDVVDCFFVDSGLSYDGRDQAGTVTFSGGTLWDYTETFTATLAGAAVSLSAANIGDAFVIADPDDSTIQYVMTITAVDSTTECTVRPNRQIPAALQGANSDWAFAILDVGGLDHLEGKELAILADGNVHPARTVESGSITLQDPATVIHAGLPIEADFETLDINVPGGETLRDKHKLIPTVRLVVEDTRGLKAGQSSDWLDEIKQRSTEFYDEATRLVTGLQEVKIDCNYNKQGRVFIRQSDPLPATILAVIPEIVITNA